MENVSTKEKLSVISGSCLGFIGILIGTSLVVTFPTLIREFNCRSVVGIRILFSCNGHNECDGLFNEAFSASANFYVSGTGVYSGVLD